MCSPRHRQKITYSFHLNCLRLCM